MSDTQADAKNPMVMPSDPAMAASDPAMFAPMTASEDLILRQHLTSAWYKQSAVYPTLSEPWKETAALLDDLHSAWNITWKGELQLAEGSPSTEPKPEPEAGQ